MATLFLKQSIPHLLEGVPEGRGSYRGKSSVEQSIPPKRSAVCGVAILVMAVAFLMTACTKPEKKALTGIWRWTATTGGIAGVWFTPESEGFEAELVFNGSSFTFYKDGEKVTSGNYRIDYESDMEPYPNIKGNDEAFYSWFNLNIPAAQCKKISEATNGRVAPFSKSFAVISYDDRYDAQVLSMNDHCYDGFSYTFVKR